MFQAGASFPAEIRPGVDERTGTTVWQVTSHASINHNLYFLTSSITADGGGVVFASDRSGTMQFYHAGFPEGPIRVLTAAEGVHGYSGVLTADGEELIYTAAGAIRAVDLTTLRERVLGLFPDASLGECDLSADGQWVVTAMKKDGASHIVLAARNGSGAIPIFQCPRTIIHPQFHPTDSALLEYAQDPAPRIWTIRIDGSENRCLHEHDNDEFVVHETWLGATGDLVYVRWPYALHRLRLPGRQVETICELNAWHIAASRDGARVLCDTRSPDRGICLIDCATGRYETLCWPRASCQGTQWDRDRYALAEDWAAAAHDRSMRLSWMEMKTDTVYGPQWTHPHPSFSPDERYVVFTSDRTGTPQVYVAAVPQQSKSAGAEGSAVAGAPALEDSVPS